MRSEDLLVAEALKEIAGILATTHERYLRAVRIAAAGSEKELDNTAGSSPHVVDGRRTGAAT